MKELFPELTEKQFTLSLSLSWSWGHNINNLALEHGCSPEAIRKNLYRSKVALELDSLDALRSTILLRLFVHMFQCSHSYCTPTLTA